MYRALALHCNLFSSELLDFFSLFLFPPTYGVTFTCSVFPAGIEKLSLAEETHTHNSLGFKIERLQYISIMHISKQIKVKTLQKMSLISLPFLRIKQKVVGIN